MVVLSFHLGGLILAFRFPSLCKSDAIPFPCSQMKFRNKVKAELDAKITYKKKPKEDKGSKS